MEGPDICLVTGLVLLASQAWFVSDGDVTGYHQWAAASWHDRGSVAFCFGGLRAFPVQNSTTSSVRFLDEVKLWGLKMEQYITVLFLDVSTYQYHPVPKDIPRCTIFFYFQYQGHTSTQRVAQMYCRWNTRCTFPTAWMNHRGVIKGHPMSPPYFTAKG